MPKVSLTSIVIIEVEYNCFISADHKIIASSEGWIYGLGMDCAVRMRSGVASVEKEAGQCGGVTYVGHDVKSV